MQVAIDQFISTTQEYTYYQGSSDVRKVQVINTDGCDDSWEYRCKHICVVKAYAPTDGSGDISIFQSSLVSFRWCYAAMLD